MTIADLREKCKNLIAEVPRDTLVIGILLAVSILSFWLGYMAGIDASA